MITLSGEEGGEGVCNMPEEPLVEMEPSNELSAVLSGETGGFGLSDKDTTRTFAVPLGEIEVLVITVVGSDTTR